MLPIFLKPCVRVLDSGNSVHLVVDHPIFSATVFFRLTHIIIEILFNIVRSRIAKCMLQALVVTLREDVALALIVGVATVA